MEHFQAGPRVGSGSGRAQFLQPVDGDVAHGLDGDVESVKFRVCNLCSEALLGSMHDGYRRVGRDLFVYLDGIHLFLFDVAVLDAVRHVLHDDRPWPASYKSTNPG